MTTHKIRLIIALMSGALIGLVAFQFYWFKSAVKAKNEQFGVLVQEAMEEAVKGMEKQEVTYLLAQRIATQEKQRSLLAIGKAQQQSEPMAATTTKQRSKPIPRRPAEQRTASQASDWEQFNSTITTPSDVLMKDFKVIPEGELTFIQNFFRQNRDLEIQFKELRQVHVEHERQLNEIVLILDGQLRQMHVEEDTLHGTSVAIKGETTSAYASPNLSEGSARRYTRRTTPKAPTTITASAGTVVAKEPSKLSQKLPPKSLQESFKRVENKSQLVKEVFNDFVRQDRKPSDRVNRSLLDSLLRKELSNRGIDIPYEYAVKTAESPNSFLFCSTALTSTETKLRQEGYKASLFPNDMFSENNFVYVYFPSRQQFILGSMWMPSLSSFVLILVILACFYIAVNTIVQQKKLADIKNDFINNMTHELKTPVSTISLACEMLQDPTVQTVPSMFDRYLKVIQDENRRLGQQVERVLQTALLEKGEVKLRLGLVNIHEVIEKALNNIGVQIEQKNGTVDLQLDADEPMIEADEIHLTNVIFNLLDNANKYSPEKPDISIETRNTERGLVVRVADKGIGMSKDSLKHIFEKFYRVPTGNLHDVKGFGLGLSYVKKMIEHHHGEIQVDSHLGKGSVFEIMLPVHQPAVVES
jgi:two-component system phosphate regulon sensor histidine kinase PhoR